MSPKKKIKDPREILKEFQEILQMEIKAARVYQQLAEDCDHPRVKEILERISLEEKGHANIAKKLVKIAEFFCELREEERGGRSRSKVGKNLTSPSLPP